MKLPDGVLDLSLTFQRPEATFVIHPVGLETERGLIVVDVGVAGAADQLGERLEGHGYGWDDVAMVLLTHQDQDHAGSLADVVARSGAISLAHREDAPYIDGRLEPLKSRGRPRYPAHPVDVQLAGGERLQTRAGPAEIIFTPGHTPGHVAVHLPDARFLLTGDAMTAADGKLQGFNEAYTPDPQEATRSIGRLAELDVERTLCYHGGLVEAGTEHLRAIHRRLTA